MLPRIESYFNRWASVFGLVSSFTATNSISGFPSAARKTLRPMRPKPLIPTFTDIRSPSIYGKLFKTEQLNLVVATDCFPICDTSSTHCRLNQMGGIGVGVYAGRRNLRRGRE